MRPAYHRAAAELRKAGSVLVCAHVKPDGDAIGSVLALTLALREAGIAAIPTLADSDPPPSTYAFLPGFRLFVPASELKPADVFVAIDTPNVARLGQAAALFEAARTTIVLDHHPDNSGFGTVNITDPSTAASGLLVWRLLESLGVTPTSDIALCCWVALVTDTGRFAYGNTTPDALRDGADMLDSGVDPAEAHRFLFESRSLTALALEALVLSRVAVVNDGRVGYAWVSSEDYATTHADPADTEHLIDAIRSIAGIDVAVLLRIDSDDLRVNLRAKSGFDVGAVARHWGGGGHAAASGFTVTGSRDSVLSQLLPLLPGGASS